MSSLFPRIGLGGGGAPPDGTSAIQQFFEEEQFQEDEELNLNCDMEFYNDYNEDGETKKVHKEAATAKSAALSLAFCNNKDGEQKMFDDFISIVRPKKQDVQPVAPPQPGSSTNSSFPITSSSTSSSTFSSNTTSSSCLPTSSAYIEINLPESDRQKTNQKKLYYSSLGFSGLSRERRLSTSPCGGRVRRTSSGSPSGRISTSPPNKQGWLFGSSPPSASSPFSTAVGPSAPSAAGPRRTRISSGGRRSSSSMAGTPPPPSPWGSNPATSSGWGGTPSSAASWGSSPPQWTSSTWVPVRNTVASSSLVQSSTPPAGRVNSTPAGRVHSTVPAGRVQHSIDSVQSSLGEDSLGVQQITDSNPQYGYIEEDDMKSLYINRSKTDTRTTFGNAFNIGNNSPNINSSSGGSLLRQQLQGKFSERKSTETVLCKECGNTLTVKCIMGTCLKSDEVLCTSCKRELTVKCILNSCRDGL